MGQSSKLSPGRGAERIHEVMADTGGNVDANPTLASAVQKARDSSVPSDNIARAIKRGTGELEGESYEEVSYEAYGPGGVAILVRCLTNNRNRAAQDVRGALNAAGAKLAEPGSVAWMFEPKGMVLVERASADEDTVFLSAADAGAEDVSSSEESYEVVTTPGALSAVRKALEDAGAVVESAELTQVPKSTVALDGGDAKRMLSLLEALEELDDVSEVYANFDISDEVLAQSA